MTKKKMKAVNATVKEVNHDFITKQAIKDNRSFSNMLDVIIDKYKEVIGYDEKAN